MKDKAKTNKVGEKEKWVNAHMNNETLLAWVTF
jgi:hypothetical protein